MCGRKHIKNNNKKEIAYNKILTEESVYIHILNVNRASLYLYTVYFFKIVQDTQRCWNH